MRVFHHGNLVEPRHHLADILECRLQPTKALHIGGGPHVFVMRQHRQTVLVVNSDHRVGKAPLFPCNCSTPLRFHCQQISILARKAVFGGNNVRRNPLRHEIGLHRKRWVHRNRRPVAAHGHAAHHLHPARDIAVASTATNLVGGDIHRLHSAGAEPVDRQSRNALVQIRRQHSRPCQTPALFAHLRDIAPDHIFHRMAFQPVARLYGVQNLGGQSNRRQFVQRPIAAALATWRPDCVIDKSVVHHRLLQARSAGEPGIMS